MNVVLIPLIFLLGISLGSFLNALIWRIYKNKSLLERSMCTHCNEQILWYDNIPVLSFLALRGACRNCKENIPTSYPLVEVWMGCVFVFITLFFYGNPLLIVRDAAIVFLLTATFLYDLKYGLILDRFTTIPAIVLFIAFAALGTNSVLNMVIGVLIGSGFFLFQYLVSEGKWIGGGDIRLGAFMGVVLSWPLILIGLFLAYILGAFVSIVLIALKKKSLASKTPFGTYLTVATFVAMYWGADIIVWYLNLTL